MNATTGPVFLAAFEDPDEVLEFAISIGLYVFVVLVYGGAKSIA